MITKDYPDLKDHADYEAFKRKWQYLFAYAGAGFAQGYITCHMLTFIRDVSSTILFFVLLDKNTNFDYYYCSLINQHVDVTDLFSSFFLHLGHFRLLHIIHLGKTEEKKSRRQ
jgi:hypothetical protein